MKNGIAITLSGALFAATGAAASAANLIQDDFSTFSDGDLAGQNGWAQDGSTSGLPIQVDGGRVVIPGGQASDAQDVDKAGMIALSAGVNAVVGATVTVFDAPTAENGSSYFLALEDSGSSAFDNARIVVRELSPTTFAFGFRATGQAQNPFVFTNALNYGDEHAIVLEWNTVVGTGNDVVNFYVDGELAESQTQASSTGDPAGFQSVILGQFGNASGTVTGDLSIGKIAYGASLSEVNSFVVPEPASLALLGAGAILMLRRRTV